MKRSSESDFDSGDLSKLTFVTPSNFKKTDLGVKHAVGRTTWREAMLRFFVIAGAALLAVVAVGSVAAATMAVFFVGG